MKAISSFVMMIAVAVSAALWHASPRHSAAAGEANSIQQQIVAKEREELDSLKNGKLEVFANLLADDAVFVDAEGPATKAEILHNVAGFSCWNTRWRALDSCPISAKSGLISYRIFEKGDVPRKGIRDTGVCFCRLDPTGSLGPSQLMTNDDS